jgi:hypothetical protein
MIGKKGKNIWRCVDKGVGGKEQVARSHVACTIASDSIYNVSQHDRDDIVTSILS